MFKISSTLPKDSKQNKAAQTAPLEGLEDLHLDQLGNTSTYGKKKTSSSGKSQGLSVSQTVTSNIDAM